MITKTNSTRSRVINFIVLSKIECVATDNYLQICRLIKSLSGLLRAEISHNYLRPINNNKQIFNFLLQLV